ncbi:TetR/AcrR family transcriptional regulator [Actinomadura sp. ATCC 31491]|uniref:TetR/AcrR family transcriptional regulator n=1 Tax=Actinomadura luzonensis TaxID=2805427 RepID=A0ABT0FUL2_9ACTN|nr:TetR/AcrR family transcriptional regulator [Actinomadura luzonensis]MCK2215853.1 TetR/AcrR family transcriptional regulator [Actinomadura luzonensis]
MSGDRRVRRTRRLVQEALVALILEKGYDAVTVTDVIHRADVGRSTFYAHFADKRDVLFSNLDELDFLRPGPVGEGGRLFAFSLPLFEHAHERRRLLRALLGRRGGGNQVLARGEELLHALVHDELRAAGARPSAALDLLATCLAGAFLALLRSWVDGATTATPAELDAAFRAAVEPGARAFLAAAGPERAAD